MSPHYDYECHDCALVFDAKVPWDGPHPHCPYCGSPSVSRRPPLVSAHFKGSGFYETDYKRKDKEDDSSQ